MSVKLSELLSFTGARLQRLLAEPKWLAHISYIATAEGWLYLARVLDTYSRPIVNWSMGERLTKSFV